MQRLALVAILAVSAFTACAPVLKTGPPPPRPKEAAPVAPAVVRAQESAAAQNETAAKLEIKVETLRDTAATLRKGMITATDEANRLRVQKTATEKELTDLWGMMSAEAERSRELARQAEESQTLAATQKAQRIAAEKALAEAGTAATLLDSEAENLRRQNDAMAATIETARKTEATLQDRLTAAEKKAAVGTYLKGIVWILGICAFLALALWIASKWRPIPLP